MIMSNNIILIFIKGFLMNYELLSRLAMQDSERLKSENLILVKKIVLLEQENKNLKDFNNIIEKERNAYKERMGQIKNEANGLIIEKNLLLDEIIILENKIKKLEEKLLAKEEERQETNNLRQKIRIDEDGEIIKNKDQIRAKNISKSVEFYS
jgi:predicted nuclease with TOPRIM domain